jgi:hypothetical protein
MSWKLVVDNLSYDGKESMEIEDTLNETIIYEYKIN